MKADTTDQRRLLDLQAVDSDIDHLEQRVITLPIHLTIAELSQRRQVGHDEVVAAQTVRSDAEVTRARAEADVVPVKERLARNQARVQAGTLEAKALTAMLDEINHLKNRITTLEDQELEAMEALEQAEADVAAAQFRLQVVEAALAAAVADRESVIDQARQEMTELRGRRHALVAALPADLVTLYDKVRARYHGVGAAALDGRRCTGCGLEATTADYNAYKAAPPDEVLRCTECQRLLVRP